ncbi:isoprenylcysteine carboxylmethyltransferase family protein [Massilia sp. erpn]|uniref:methyltransferase family protein n=1 Tax=Massilia sp. erpn TaxID=2738142 RepID=UPI002107F2B8|nr:isoprenylcysteine carboxylmethyltransferase family protein [Massilia sp. erpn]
MNPTTDTKELSTMRQAVPLASRRTNLLLGAVLACAWALFAWAHVQGFRHSGDWSYLLFFASETLVALLFLLRSEPVKVSHSPLDWGLAIGCTAAPLFFAPAGWALLPAAKLILVAGIVLQIGGLLSLNRSFGLVAAQRQIKTRGLYSVVRHPLYASYLLSYCGYVLANTSLANLLVCLTAALLLVVRLRREERFLSQAAEYRSYMEQVKYRVIPLIF